MKARSKELEMAREEDQSFKALGFFGICREAINIILKWRKIFLQITLTLIVPLSPACLAYIGVSLLLLSNIEDVIASSGTVNIFYSESIALWFTKMVVLGLFIILFSLSVAIVVCTIACVYSGKESIAFKEVVGVIPGVRKRLMETLLWGFGIILAYNSIVIFLFLVIFSTLFSNSDIEMGILLGKVLYTLYLMGLAYMAVIWQLTIPTLVLEEENYGIQAMKKSKELIKGKMGIAVSIVLLGAIWGGGVGFLFGKFVVSDQSIGVVWKVGIGILSLLLLIVLFLFGLVVQSVFYFVDKSYHHESVDYTGILDGESKVGGRDYAPLNSRV